MKSLKYILIAFCFVLFACDDDTDEVTNKAMISDDAVEVYQETKALIDLTQSLSNTSTSAVPTDFDTNAGARTSNEFFCGILEAFNSTSGCISYEFSCTEEGDMLSTIKYGDGCTQAGESLSGTITVLTVDAFNFARTENKNIITYDKLKIRQGEINGTTTIISDLQIQDASIVKSSSQYTVTSAIEEITVNSSDTIFSGSIAGEPPYTTTHDVTFEASSSLGYTVSGVTSKPIFATSDCKIDDTIDVFFPVEGTQDLVVTGILGRSHDLVLDYGDGTCDDTYTVTDDDGNVRTYDLRDDSEVLQ